MAGAVNEVTCANHPMQSDNEGGVAHELHMAQVCSMPQDRQWLEQAWNNLCRSSDVIRLLRWLRTCI